MDILGVGGDEGAREGSIYSDLMDKIRVDAITIVCYSMTIVNS